MINNQNLFWFNLLSYLILHECWTFDSKIHMKINQYIKYSRIRLWSYCLLYVRFFYSLELPEENQLSKSRQCTLTFNNQQVLMPPVKAPLGTNTISKQKMAFVKVISGFYEISWKSLWALTLQQEKKSDESQKVFKISTQNISFDKTVNEPVKFMNKNPYFELNIKEKSLKEKVKILKEQMSKTNTLVLNTPLMSDIVLCRSARVLQKYGCLHKDPVNAKWRF